MRTSWGKGKSEAEHVMPGDSRSTRWGPDVLESEGMELKSIRTTPPDEEEEEDSGGEHPLQLKEERPSQTEEEPAQPTSLSSPRKTPVWSKKSTKP